MDCGDVKRVLYFFLDGQLGEQKKQAVDSHLHLCASCEARKEIQQRLRGFFQKRIARMSAPDHLKTRLARSLRAFRAEWTREVGRMT